MERQTQDIAGAYPVRFEVQAPERFDRIQLLLRFLVWIALGALQQSTSGAFGALYLLLPIVAAVLISHRGGDYLARDAGWLTTLLEWVTGVYAYLLFVTDRFPLDTRARSARLHVLTEGAPSTGQALARLVTSLPHMLLLLLLGIASSVVALIAAVAILFGGRYPAPLYGFQRDVVAYGSRLLAFHASLVESYPPFSLATPRTPLPPADEAGPAAREACAT